jgi:hypothetical protein
MIEITVENADEVQEAIDQIMEVASGSWATALEPLGVSMYRNAVSISPVVTGSYAGAHRITVGDKVVTLEIDPQSRNFISGGLVTDYAGAVERRHSVYSRTADVMYRLAADVENVLAEEMGL